MSTSRRLEKRRVIWNYFMDYVIFDLLYSGASVKVIKNELMNERKPRNNDFKIRNINQIVVG